jgi:hypothetical protein
MEPAMTMSERNVAQATTGEFNPLCPACGAPGMDIFYRVERVPVNSVLLLTSRQAAVEIPRGDLALGLCHACGFISNTAFDAAEQQYNQQYEATQGFSPTFSSFHRRLAQSLIDRYDLRGKDVIEIGCDKGDFLTLLCELGDNRGVGFDPAYVEGRIVSSKPVDITFIRDFYDERYAHYSADFYACKMTLEHIQDVFGFVRTVRRSIGDRRESVVFFQIPEVRRVLTDLAFWDIYYEHVSYFSKGSLARLFRRAGFDVQALWTDYDDQYLMIEARPGDGGGDPLPEEDDLAAVEAEVEAFRAALPARLAEWRERLGAYHRSGKQVVLWGGGSKGVAFLTTLGITAEVPFAVDINPFKAGTFLAGNGQKIIPPADLKTIQPDVVIVMNPIYMDEIRADLAKMRLSPELVAIDA